jgi:hypothetical protein
MTVLSNPIVIISIMIFLVIIMLNHARPCNIYLIQANSLNSLRSFIGRLGLYDHKDQNHLCNGTLCYRRLFSWFSKPPEHAPGKDYSVCHTPCSYCNFVPLMMRHRSNWRKSSLFSMIGGSICPSGEDKTVKEAHTPSTPSSPLL